MTDFAAADRKLRDWILPYVFSAKLVKRRPFLLMHEGLRFTTLLLAALATVGLTSPRADHLLGVVFPSQSAIEQTQPTANPGASDVAQGVQAASVAGPAPRESQENPLARFSVLALIAVALLRSGYEFFDVAKRGVLARASVERFEGWASKIDAVLQANDESVLGELSKMQKQMSDAVQQARDEKWWPWDDIFAPDTLIDAKVNSRMAVLNKRHNPSPQTAPAVVGLSVQSRVVA